MYRVRPPAVLRALLPRPVWCMPPGERDVYLTFDDGPIPEVTPWVLDQLAGAGAKATFFCIGRNIEVHPHLLARIRAEGHAVGNHTWQHVNGWKTGHHAYLRDVLRCQALTGTDLFRPPYGRLTPRLVRVLSPRFKVVMWDVLSADFDTAIHGERCLRNVLAHVRPGSIVVFHDSVKAWPRLEYALPRALRHLRDEGYTMQALPMRPVAITPGSR